MNYVIHFCRNKNCNNCWLDKDLTNAQSRPPAWKYCESCCNEMGINFDNQVYKSKLSDEEKEKRRNRLNKRLILNRKKRFILKSF